MVFFRWSDQFTVYDDRMDEQHRQFLEALNGLYAATRERKDATSLRSTLDLLSQYADHHFGAEERLLRAAGYPKLEDQVRQHSFFRGQVAELRRAFEGSATTELQSTLQFMRDWFLRHILEADRGYAEYLNEPIERS
ncbi:MAG: bacteriohemerythrin [Deferrisomatales bacterium]